MFAIASRDVKAGRKAPAFYIIYKYNYFQTKKTQLLVLFSSMMKSGDFVKH